MTSAAGRITIGSAPDSWGVWFADDPAQTPATRFLDEVAAAGYEWVEIGPYGYLPTDPDELRDALAQRGLKVSAGTVFEDLHRPGSWDRLWTQVGDVAALTRAVGGQHLVVIPAMWRDERTGQATEERELDAAGWAALTAGMDTLGRRVAEEYGLQVQFHPHADSHVGRQHDIERFLEATDPALVNLCLDTGHVAYFGGDSVDLITRYPERIGYLHLKQVDPVVLQRVTADDVPWRDAVALGVMTEPPLGIPDTGAVLSAVGSLGRDVFGIVEQDLYPCAPDAPLPIARRTHTHLAGCGVPAVRLGTPLPLRRQP